MTSWCIALLILLLNISPAYQALLKDAAVVFELEDCRGKDGWYTVDTIHVCYDSVRSGEASLSQILIHEAQHHFQYKTGIGSRRAGWDVFDRTVVKAVCRSDMDVECMMVKRTAGQHGHYYSELHAELPCFLDGNIPGALRPWYPWLGENGIWAGLCE